MKQWFENKSVAVVGNAQSLFDNSYGDLIDSCDVVCRINVGIKVIDPVAQGQKTDVHVFSKWQWMESLNLLDYNRKNLHTSYKGRDDINEKISYYPLENHNQLKLQLGLSKKEKPSTGLVLLDYISSICTIKVSIFGFDWKDTPTYYENDPQYNTKRDADPHCYDKEKTYLLNLCFQKTEYNIY
jgi:hypothetical protein